MSLRARSPLLVPNGMRNAQIMRTQIMGMRVAHEEFQRAVKDEVAAQVREALAGLRNGVDGQPGEPGPSGPHARLWRRLSARADDPQSDRGPVG